MEIKQYITINSGGRLFVEKYDNLKTDCFFEMMGEFTAFKTEDILNEEGYRYYVMCDLYRIPSLASAWCYDDLFEKFGNYWDEIQKINDDFDLRKKSIQKIIKDGKKWILSDVENEFKGYDCFFELLADYFEMKVIFKEFNELTEEEVNIFNLKKEEFDHLRIKKVKKEVKKVKKAKKESNKNNELDIVSLCLV